MQNGKNEFRAVIKYLHMKGLMPKEIKAELNTVHSISALATVYNWVNEFKCGRTFTCDALRSNRSFFVKELLKSIVKRLRLLFVNVNNLCKICILCKIFS